jgi:L-lactate dehydrogenase complex protein LldG
MSSRDTILQRIRSGLGQAEAAGFAHLSPPPVPEVWPRVTSDPAVLAARFEEELRGVQGEPIRCASMDEARSQLARLTETEGWTTVGAFDRPLAREVASSLPAERITWTHGDWQPREMATLSASLITAEALLADSGTCVVACPTAPERLLCYLPPACVVVARIDQLAEHLPAAWGELTKRLADPAARGELVMVTGPSRTADIEKILILGAHGPKRLVVLLVG